MSILTAVYHRMNRWNYEYGLFPRKANLSGVEVQTYELINNRKSDRALSRMIESVGSEDTVWDIGANRGDYVIALGNLSNPPTIIAFEPNPEVFSRLKRNIRLNNIDVEIKNIGLSNSDGSFTFYVSSEPTMGSFEPQSAKKGNAKIVKENVVQVSTIDDLVDAGVSAPTHLKIDVEGHGLEVINGAQKTLEEVGPEVYFEIHEGSSEEQASDVLSAIGYDIVNLEPNNTNYAIYASQD